MRILETIAGVGILLSVLVAVNCLPGMTRHPQRPALNDAAAPFNCATSTKPQMLCDRVTLDGRRECAICVELGCDTSTGIFCARSCDDPACRPR